MANSLFFLLILGLFYILGVFVDSSRRKYWVVLLLAAMLQCAVVCNAQQMGTAVSTFLEFPVSAHTAALGGNTVSFTGGDQMFAFSNPASLGAESHNQINLNYSVYMYHTGYASAAYTYKFSDKDVFMAGFQAAMYGKMKSYDASGTEIGTVSANDFAFTATYSRLLNKYFSIGVTLKPAINSYGGYTSFSLGGDVGVMFHDTVSLVNVGLAVQNFGGRLAGPEGVTLASKWMPLNVTLGVSKRLKKAPIVFYLTLQNLQKWNDSNVGLMIGKKFIVGMDIMPKSEKFWVGLSYNFDRGLSLGNPTVMSLSGLSFGGGAKLYMLRLGVGIAFYSTSAVTAHFSLAMDINWFNKKFRSSGV